MKQFYIYVHCRPDGEPFYVGKGSGRRAYEFVSGRNKYHKNIVSKYGRENISIFIYLCQSEQQAFEYEVWLKQWCELQDFTIVNLVDGGGGISGYHHTEKTIRKIRAAHFGVKRSSSTIERLRIASMGNKRALGYKHTEETKAKMCKPRSEETRAKLRVPKSPEHREKLKQANIRRAKTPEFLAQIAARPRMNNGKFCKEIL